MEEKVREGKRQKQESKECYPASGAGTEQVEKWYVWENGVGCVLRAGLSYVLNSKAHSLLSTFGHSAACCWPQTWESCSNPSAELPVPCTGGASIILNTVSNIKLIRKDKISFSTENCASQA